MPAGTDSAYIANGGTASITKTGAIGFLLDLGNGAGSGSVQMSAGNLSSEDEYLGFANPGSFVQSGGTNNSPGGSLSLYLGYNANSLGTYSLGGSGLLVPGELYVGYNGTGIFNQSGGTNAGTTFGGGQVGILVGYGSGSSGTYNLSGSGVVSALQDEYVGYNAGSRGSFQQTGGSNSADGLFIGTGGTYTLSGGTLQITAKLTSASVYGSFDCGSCINAGIFDGGNGMATLMAASCTLDLTSGTWRNMEHTNVVMGGNTLLIVPKGFDTSTDFGSYSSLGLTHTAGTTMTVPVGALVTGSFASGDPLICQGSLAAFLDVGSTSPGAINLNGGIAVSGTASLGSGTLTINNVSSNITGGLLQTPYAYVGSGGTGPFSHSAGTVQLIAGIASGNLYLGYQAGDMGTYTLANGQLLTYNLIYTTGGSECLGCSGSGLLTQTSGSNSTSQIYLGYNPGSRGTYNLSGSGGLSAGNEYVGYNGTGVLTQSGGTNTVATALSLAGGSSPNGTYNLSGGLLVVSSLSVGSGSASFNFSGGTLRSGSSFSIALPMMLGSSGGGATFDTAGYTVTLSGSLSGPGSLTKVGSGTLILAATDTYSGNTLVRGGTLALGSSLALQNSTLDTSGSGILSFGSLSSGMLGGLTGTGTLKLANTSSSAEAVSVGNNNGSSTFSGMLQGAGGLTKIGSGVLSLSGSNTYTGPTTISQGKLTIDGWLPNSAVSVSDGTLGGTGYLSSVSVSASGTLAPGDPLGVLHLSGNLVLSVGAAMDFDLDGFSTDDEVYLPSGSLTFSGQQFSNFGFTWSAGFGPGTYTLVNAKSITGLGSNLSGSIDGLPATLSVSNNNLMLTVVPEPSTAALLGAGTISIAAYVWRRRRTDKANQFTWNYVENQAAF